MNPFTNEMTMLQIGKPFPTQIEMKPGQDMVVSLEMYFDAEGKSAHLFLIQAINNLTFNEGRILDQEAIHTRVYCRNNHFLFLFRYGATPLLLESTLDASLYLKEGIINNFSHVELSDLITIVRIDPSTNCIDSMRAASLPRKYKQRILQAIQVANDTTDYTERYRGWIQSIWSKYTSLQLWPVAEDTGRLGE